MKEELLKVAIQQLPGVLALLRAHIGSDDTSTDEDWIVALNEAVNASVAKDDRWLAAHPPKP